MRKNRPAPRDASRAQQSRKLAPPADGESANGEAARSAAAFIHPGASLDELRAAARGCTGCDLYRTATQTVFGAGASDARIVFVGEQPGDYEDRMGEPFVGPAGRLLDKALVEAGIDRKSTYVTNAVKHFKWIIRGKKRIHQKPRVIEITACLPWLLAEIDRIRPDVVVCLGATAAQALLGSGFRVTEQRGRAFSTPFGKVIATVHPSSLLRIPNPAGRKDAYRGFVNDLRHAAEAAAKPGREG